MTWLLFARAEEPDASHTPLSVSGTIRINNAIAVARTVLMSRILA